MNHYRHLSTEERENLLIMRTQGVGLNEAARQLNRSPSTISRELQRNGGGKYSAARAEKAYHTRRKNCVRKRRLADPQVYETVVNLLNKYWSPEQINHRLKVEENQVQIGTATIYRAISSGPIAPQMRKKLRRKGHSHKGFSACGHLPIHRTIHERPAEANERSRLGDWECDTVRGAKQSGNVATLVDRKSRYTLCAKLSDGTATAYTEAVIALFKQLGKKHARTLTCDRGKEFAQYARLEQALNCEVYFADPFRPNQRGTNENTNGLLRQFLPKRTSFAHITQHNVTAFANLLNRRPRKCLGWKTPLEVFSGKLLHLT